MTPNWLFQVMWFGAGVGGSGAVWYFLSQRNYRAAVWTCFATVVVVSLAVVLYIQNDLLRGARGSGPSWYSLPAVWTSFAVVVIVLLAIALYVPNHLQRREQQTDSANRGLTQERRDEQKASSADPSVVPERLASTEQKTTNVNSDRPPHGPASEEPKTYLKEKSPNEVAARINALEPLERDLVAEHTYIGRWIRWSGHVLNIRRSSSFLKGGAFTVMAGDYVLGHATVSLEFLPTERHQVESLQEGDLISYEAQITRVFSHEVYLTTVTFMQAEERQIVDVTPDYLMHCFEGRTDLQASIAVADYIGKWMRVSGRLGNVSSASQVTFADHSPTHMFFRKKNWIDRLSILRPGDNITVLGQITYVEMGNLVMDGCELIDLG